MNEHWEGKNTKCVSVCIPFKQLTADNQRTFDKDPMSQKEIFNVTGVA